MSAENIFPINLEALADAARPMTRNLNIAIGGRPAWPVSDEAGISIEIQLDDLFSYLVEFWRPLMLRQTYPFDMTVLRPSLVAREAVKRWADLPQNIIEDEAEILASFEDAHDLSRAFGGMFDLPHFWMLREGEQMLCDTGRHLWPVQFDVVRSELSKVGDQIAEHLLNTDAGTWDCIVAAWKRRDEVSDVDMVAWSASLDTEVARKLIDAGSLAAPKDFTEAANDNDPLMIAARMAGGLPIEQIVGILDIAKSFKGHHAKPLDEVSAYCLETLHALPKAVLAHSQGEAIARETRAFFKLGPSEPVDVFAFVRDLGVEIKVAAIEPETFDGLAIAGGAYGPGSFINASSKRMGHDDGPIEQNHGARVTLAHELCHLLVDRDHPLSAVEVLRSRMPAATEARARGFAGEFLLPASSAADLWDRAGSPTSPDKLRDVLQELAGHFGVTFAVAAWKLEHGSGESRKALRPVLDILAPYR
jgi:hypothetical protein